MRKVGFNGRFSGTKQPTGTQTAAFQLFDAIIRRERDVEIVVFADSRFPGIESWKSAPKLKWVETPFQDWSRNRAQIWEQVSLPIDARSQGCSIVHHPITTSPVWRNGTKSVVTLHDLNFYRHSEWYSKAFRLAYEVCAVASVKRAERVVTISNYVREQARESFGIPEDRLRMVYNGVKPMSSSAKPGGNYLLCVGSLQPHKNLSRMIKAYLEVRPEFSGLELRVVGRPQAQFTADSELPGLLKADGVKLLGYLSEQELADAYAGAELFCYPSLEEGFGLPVLESMILGVLVLTSNLSCLPEVSGPSAILVDPMSVDAIANGIRTGLNFSGDERARRVAEGHAWAARFTWDAAAGEYLKIYDEIS